MIHEEQILPQALEQTPVAYRRNPYQTRLVIGQLRDDAMASGEPFQVADLALYAADLDELWSSLDRVDTYF